MRLNRKQKTARNFLLAMLILFAWWFFNGAQPMTVRQAIRWQALELGMQEPPEILSISTVQGRQKNAVFTAEGKAVLSQVTSYIEGVDTQTYEVKELQEVTALWKQKYASLSGTIPELCVVAQQPGAAEAEVRLRIKDYVTVGHYTTLHEFHWDETYTAAAKMENGVGWFYLEGKYPKEYDENAEGYVPYQAEMQVLFHLRSAIEGYEEEHFEGTLTVIIRDSGGNTLTTYEEIL
ncbi:MAG: hypothetical protein IJX52_05195 [Oscillibacter sp.]|nr:hypothetical protein [Oscillibacter sp.]